MLPKIFLLSLASLIVSIQLSWGELLVKNGQTVAFLGDSITAQGWGSPGGYVHLVTDGLATLGVKITPIPAGISGHTSRDMLARLDHDVLSKKPDWMTLSCGVNDVWHGANGVDLPTYEKNITSILDQCQEAGIKVVVMTSTTIGEDLGNPNNVKLAAYNDFLRQTAQARHLPLAEENAAYQTIIKAAGQHEGLLLTVDGVHPNPDGHQAMAKAILKAFGATPAQLEQVEQGWMAKPEIASMRIAVNFTIDSLTLPQYAKLKAMAAENHTTPDKYGVTLFVTALRNAFAAHASDKAEVSPAQIQTEARRAVVKQIDAMPNPS